MNSVMNPKKYLFIVAMICLATSCNEKIEMAPGLDNFQVHVESQTAQVGDEVNFKLSGKADMITFYSGEFGHDYEYREGRIIPPGNAVFSFSMRNHYPSRPAADISVLVSTDFEGNRAVYQDIKGATWTDVTDRCFIDGSKGDAYYPSGEIDVTDLAEEGRPMYFAFKYAYHVDRQGLAPTIIRVDDFRVQIVGPLGAETISTSIADDFLPYSTGGPDKDPTRSSNNGSVLLMRANAPSAIVEGIEYTNTTYTEDYFVSVPFHVTESIDNGRDTPHAIKGNENPQLTEYSYVYKEPGVYQVYFVATNANVDTQKQVVRSVEITITN